MASFVRSTVLLRYAGGRSEAAVRRALTYLSTFADWVLTTGVGPLDESVLVESAIDAFTAHRTTQVKPAVAERERKFLRALGGLPPAQEQRLVSTTATPSTPYTPAEQGAIRRWAESQPTADRRRTCGAIAALGLGCGLTTKEIMHVRRRDIVMLDDAMTGVDVTVGRTRTVPVIADWENALAVTRALPSSQFLVAPGASTRLSGSARTSVLRLNDGAVR